MIFARCYKVGMTPKQVIKHYGNGDLREAAYRLGYSENALRYWVKKNRVPRHAQKRIALDSGGKLKKGGGIK